MKLKNILSSIFVLLLGTNVLFAGTSNIKGVYKGKYDLEIKGLDNNIYAKSSKEYNWTLDFDKGELSIENGKIKTLTTSIVSYKITGEKSLIDNKDGTYTFISEFQPITLVVQTPKVLVKSVLEITQTNKGLVIKTLDSDDDGVLGSVSSEIGLDYSLILPKKVELNWSGNAE